MATNVVNLDALIPREDFDVKEPGADFKRGDTFRITDLEPGVFTYGALRKPDFQRETANWSPQKIQDFVQTFLSGDLVPAIILWGAGGKVFVIDGAHRLSALIAWVHDDYGAGKRSREFFDNDVPPEQVRAANRTRTLIDKTIGTYAEHQLAANPENTSRPEVRERALRLSSLALQLQWVPSTDAKKAEASFFKINQAFTEIDPTELRILRARTHPNAVAARAIVRNATGHQYWSTFPVKTQKEIRETARDVYSTLFTPPLDTPIKTMDVPVAGRGYSAYTLPLIFELVNLANDIPVIDPSKGRKNKDDKQESNSFDSDGTATQQFLKNTRKLVRRIGGTHPSSLGLHPLVYFYSATGRYQPTAFLAIAAFVRDLEKEDLLLKFTKVRAKLEEFLVQHKNFINQTVVRFGSMAKGYAHVRDLVRSVMDALLEEKSDDRIVALLQSQEQFRHLSTAPETRAGRPGADFDKETKSAAYLREALGNPPVRCHICGGYMHEKSMHIDHAEPKRDGGTDHLDNAQLAHPYCDSTVKH